MFSAAETLEKIYEAAFFPQNWYEILDHMAEATNAQGTSLVSTSSPTTHWLASEALEDMTQKMIEEGWVTRNARAEKLLSIEQFGFVDEAEHFSEADYNAIPIFTDMMQPLGYGFGMSTFISTPSGDKIIVAVEKKKATGPVEKSAIAYLGQLRPHLARAAMMSSRLEFERINAAVEALQLTGLPSAVLTFDGRVMLANKLLEGFAPQIGIVARDRLRFAHVPANDVLANAISQLQSGALHLKSASRSFPLPRYEDAPPVIVHLVPVLGDARDVFARAAFFLVVTPVDRTRVPTAETIGGLFDLSPAEARVARSLAAGNDVGGTASTLSLSAETVRSHVKAILAKSGMSRQTDFVAAVASIRPIA